MDNPINNYSHVDNTVSQYQLDYSALRHSIGFFDVIRVAIQKIPEANVQIVFLFIVLALPIVVLLVAVSIFISAVDIPTYFSAFYFVTFSLFASMAIFNLYRYFRKYALIITRTRSFAKANNVVLLERSRALSDRKGILFHTPNDTREVTSYTFPNYNNLEIGNFDYPTRAGEDGEGYGFIKINLPSTLPHMLFDSKTNNEVSFLTNLPETIPESKTLYLEGDFNKFFAVRTLEGHEQDALYVLTPDFMRILIDEMRIYDFEIIDNELYVYRNGPYKLYEEKDVAETLNLALTITKIIYKRSSNFSSTETYFTKNGNSSALVSSAAQNNNVLKFGIGLFIVLCAYATFASEPNTLAIFILFFICFTTILYGVYMSRRIS